MSIPKFVQNHEVEVELEENKSCEFKVTTLENKNPAKTTINVAPEYIIAFLNVINGNGGSIYYGITNNRVIVGVTLNHSQRDEIRKGIENKISQITPPLTPNMYKVEFHPVYDDLFEVIPSLYIVETEVHKPDAELYFLNGKHCFIKTDAGRKELSGLELVSEIKKRHQLQDNHLVQLDIVDFLELIAAIKPALYWSHSHVPYTQTYDYFLTIQKIIHGQDVLFSNIHAALPVGTEYTLRILLSLIAGDDTEYAKGNARMVYDAFSGYFISMDFVDGITLDNNTTIGNISGYERILNSCRHLDLREIINFLKTLKTSLEKLRSSYSLSKNEADFIKFIILILHYAVSNYEAFEYHNKKHSDIPQHITNGFIDLIEPYFKSIGVSFLDSTSEYLDILKNHCDSEWNESTGMPKLLKYSVNLGID